MGCFGWVILLGGFLFIVISMIRWFEQVTEAVERGWWNKVFVLVAMPLTVWLFPGSVAAGRPSPAPRHEPVRGFGLPKGGATQPDPTPPQQQRPVPVKRAKPPVDPDQVAKLRQKMREQGMLDDES